MGIRIVGVGATPRMGRAGRQLVVAESIGIEIGNGGVETVSLLFLCLCEGHDIEGGLFQLEGIVEGNMIEPFLILHIPSVCLAVTPHVGGIVVGIVGHTIRIRTEELEHQSLGKQVGGVEMDIQMGIVLILLHPHQRIGVADPKRFCHLIERTVGIGTVRERGIEGGCRVKQFLLERQVVVFLYGTEDAKVYGQMVVECFLMQVEFGRVVGVVVRPYHGPVVCQASGSAVVGRL